MGDWKAGALLKQCLGETLLTCYLLPHHFCLALVASVEVSCAWPGVYSLPSFAVEKKYQQRMRLPHWDTTGMLGESSWASFVSSLFSLTEEGHSTAHSLATHSSEANCR